jgi:hypothetical protein
VRQPQIAIASKSTVRAGLLSDHEQTGSYLIPHRFRIGDSKVDGDKRVYGESTHRLSLAKSRLRAIYGRRPFTTCAISSLCFRWISVGEGVPSPPPRIQVVHGTVPQKCARNALPARSGIPCRPALGQLLCRPLPTSSARAPEVTPN